MSLRHFSPKAQDAEKQAQVRNLAQQYLDILDGGGGANGLASYKRFYERELLIRGGKFKQDDQGKNGIPKGPAKWKFTRDFCVDEAGVMVKESEKSKDGRVSGLEIGDDGLWTVRVQEGLWAVASKAQVLALSQNTYLFRLVKISGVNNEDPQNAKEIVDSSLSVGETVDQSFEGQVNFREENGSSFLELTILRDSEGPANTSDACESFYQKVVFLKQN